MFNLPRSHWTYWMSENLNDISWLGNLFYNFGCVYCRIPLVEIINLIAQHSQDKAIIKRQIGNEFEKLAETFEFPRKHWRFRCVRIVQCLLTFEYPSLCSVVNIQHIVNKLRWLHLKFSVLWISINSGVFRLSKLWIINSSTWASIWLNPLEMLSSFNDKTRLFE